MSRHLGMRSLHRFVLLGALSVATTSCLASQALSPVRVTAVERSQLLAAAGGDVERAAAAYLDAALIAAEDGRTDVVPVLLRRMQRIAASPLLRPEQRERLVARATTEPRLARYATPATASLSRVSAP